MLKFIFLFVGALLALAGPVEAQGVRNPFGVPDVVDPVNARVERLAAQISLSGDASDPNAEQWAPKPTTVGQSIGLEGDWYGRWAAGTLGMARIKVVGSRLFALYTDYSGSMSGKTWLLEAEMLGNGRLVGSWVQVGYPSDTGPFIGLIVSDERIDGIWSWDGRERWDFRRQLGTEL
ncbi:MAG TPA: hypothetical protein VH951_09175 [Dehalococcoidia bacterium]